MSKYSFEFKKKVVNAYINGEGGYHYLSEVYGIPSQNKPDKESTVDASVEHIKKLEDELLKLRIENAFLKELRRLRLEDEAKMRERRSSLTASEECSD